MKKLVSLLLVLSICIGLFPGVVINSGAEDNIRVILNDQEITFDVPPILVDGKTLVPMRKIFEVCGANVVWNGETQMITATKGDMTMIMYVGNVNVVVIRAGNAENMVLEVPPMLIDGKTLVPLRVVSETLGLTVNWNGENRIVTISGDTGGVKMYDEYPSIPDFGAFVDLNSTEKSLYENTLWYYYDSATITDDTMVEYWGLLERYGYNFYGILYGRNPIFMFAGKDANNNNLQIGMQFNWLFDEGRHVFAVLVTNYGHDEILPLPVPPDYEEWPGVPDFRHYSLIDCNRVRKVSDSTFYWYDITDKYEARRANSYGLFLTSIGFQYSRSYRTDASKYESYVYTKGNIEVHLTFRELPSDPLQFNVYICYA